MGTQRRTRKSQLPMQVAADHPGEAESVLRDALFGIDDRRERVWVADAQRLAPSELEHVVTISLRDADMRLLQALVRQMQERGFHSVNNSLVVRAALAQFNVDLFAP